MKILISNDDGIFAPGIAALVKAFAKAGHEVLVCAPDSQRSAASHSLSIARPIAVKETEFDGATKAWAIGGTPADCVKLGLTVLCPEAEAVVSGVNRGYNVGSDILYSGTVAAAMEGAICGRPALAVSQHEGRKEYDSAAKLAVGVFKQMKLEPLSVINLNYPEKETEAGKISFVMPAVMEQLHYAEEYVPGKSETGETTYTLMGKVRDDIEQSDDYQKLCEGFATVTVLKADMTDVASTKAFFVRE